MVRLSKITGAVFLLVTFLGVVQAQKAPRFELDILVDGRPLEEYYARGRTYVEALRGAEYEVRLRNSSPDRIAVALSVDGLNSIDARHTTAWQSSKWVIEPYDTLIISGWQMSSERARRFYFTTESDSYGAKLGQTANLGVITAVYFRERRRVVVAPPPDYPRPSSSTRSKSREDNAAGGQATDSLRNEEAATGIGRSVRNDVQWVDLDLESRPAGELSIHYEYTRRETSRRYCPEP